MAEQNEAESFAAASSGKSPEEVAFELLNKLKGQGVWGERNLTAILDMYAECLDAAKGLRTYAGQNRVDVPTKMPGQPQAARPAAAAAAPSQQPQARQAHVAQVQTAQSQAQHQPQTQPQTLQQPSVQQQQHALQQAYRQE